MAKERKKKIKKIVSKGVAHVYATFNNTIVSVSDKNGNVLAWDSGGTVGFKGARKSTPFAAQKAAENVAQKVSKFGVKEVDVIVKGPGQGRESAVRAFQSAGIEVKTIQDETPLPHNGCRPRKKRRV